MLTGRKFLFIFSLIALASPLVSLAVRLSVGWDLSVPLHLTFGIAPPLALAWLWHFRRWPGVQWVEVIAYALVILVANSLVTVNLLGVYFIVPFVGIIYQDWRVSAFGSLLSIAGVWVLELLILQPNDSAQLAADLAGHTFLLTAVSLLYANMIQQLKQNEEELIAARTAVQRHQIEKMAVQWGLVVDARSPYTGGHVQRVTEYALQLAPLVPGATVDLKTFRLASLLHDVGKIAVPDHILNKPGTLTPAEFDQMKAHTKTGHDLVLKAGATAEVAAIVRSHHERWDGRGYPDGLKGEAIPLEARILAVADTFDAMTSDRPYRSALRIEDAYDEIVRGKGSQFDPQVVEAFASVYPQWADLYQTFPNPVLAGRIVQDQPPFN
jgi:putative nucleotidyltransferase with HDIG domain